MKLLVVAPLLFAGCATYHASASVGRNEVGPGLGVEVGGMLRADRRGPGMFVSAEGVAGDGFDGDPFLTTVGHGRYSFAVDGHPTLTPFLTLGAGAGWVHEYENQPVAEGFAELGIEWRASRHFGAALSLRERPSVFIGNGSGGNSWHNTLHLTLTLVGVAVPERR